MPIYNTPLEFDCIGITAGAATFCLPIIVDCDIIEDDDWFNDPGDEWNDNLCQTDKCYFIPFAEGDKIQLQTRFFDPGRDTPTAYDTLINIEVLAENGYVLDASANADAIRKMTAWDGKRSYQIVEFDLSALGSCFKLQFTSGDRVIVTNSFQLLKPCRNTLKMRSTYTGTDCFGYYYGQPEEYEGDLILYNNEMRYYASIKMDGDTIQKERLGRKALTGTITNNWKIILAKEIPPYIKKIITNQHLAGEVVYIDEVEYLFDDIVIESEDTKNNMHFFTIRPQKRCNVNYRC
jgi:hypothetical protein